MAAPLSINGVPVIRATIHEALFGPWFADVEADTADDITGSAALDFEGAISFRGTVKRGEVTKKKGCVP